MDKVQLEKAGSEVRRLKAAYAANPHPMKDWRPAIELQGLVVEGVNRDGHGASSAPSEESGVARLYEAAYENAAALLLKLPGSLGGRMVFAAVVTLALFLALALIGLVLGLLFTNGDLAHVWAKGVSMVPSALKISPLIFVVALWQSIRS